MRRGRVRFGGRFGFVEGFDDDAVFEDADDLAVGDEGAVGEVDVHKGGGGEEFAIEFHEKVVCDLAAEEDLHTNHKLTTRRLSVWREDLFGGGEGAGEGDGELLAVCDFVVLFEFSGLEVVGAVDEEVDLLGVEVADGGGASGALFEAAGHRIAW